MTLKLTQQQIDSAFQLTEHLKALHNSLTHPSDKDHSVPVDRTAALRLAQPPDGVDRNIWLYELCRFLSQKANSIIIALFADDPPCSAQTCPEMRASEWQYLCAVHDPPKSCCAIDYCCHTLDWAANTLTSPKSFPSRLALGTEMNNQHTQVRQLTNIFRRVYRIFAHAWFQHRDVFWKVEGRTGLYMFFKTVCDVYNLIDKDNYTIPQEAEGLEDESQSTRRGASPNNGSRLPEPAVDHTLLAPAGNTTTITNSTTKRHRQTPSLSQAPVTTVVEEVEEDEDASGGRRGTQMLSRSDTVKESPLDSAAKSKLPETSETETKDENVKEDEPKQDPEDDDVKDVETKAAEPKIEDTDESSTGSEEEKEGGGKVDEIKSETPAASDELTDASAGDADATIIGNEAGAADQASESEGSKDGGARGGADAAEGEDGRGVKEEEATEKAA